jgi:hypothetical protein
LLSWFIHQYATIPRRIRIPVSWHLNDPFRLHTGSISRRAQRIFTAVYIGQLNLKLLKYSRDIRSSEMLRSVDR